MQRRRFHGTSACDLIRPVFIGALCENSGGSGHGREIGPIYPWRSFGGGTFGGILGLSILKLLQSNAL